MSKILRSTLGFLYRIVGPDWVFFILMGPVGQTLMKIFIRLSKDPICFRSKYGFVMEVSPYEYWMSGYMFLGETNPQETAVIISVLRVGDTMIDAGAHAGWYSLVARQCVGSEGSVLSFEPNPVCADVLNRNVKMNGFDNIQIIHDALSNKSGTSRLWVGDDMGGSLIKDQAQHITKKKVKSITVKTLRLDDFLKKQKTIKSIRCIKVDVEGAEVEVLLGAKKILLRHKPIILAEVYCKDQKQLRRRDKLFEYLKSLGYVPFLLTSHGLKITEYTHVSHDTINIVLKHHV